MMRTYTLREYELATRALERAADIERTAGNEVTALLLLELRSEIQRRPIAHKPACEVA